MPITIYRKGYPNRWESVATAKQWSIADAIGNALSNDGSEVRAICGTLTIDYTDGHRDEAADAARHLTSLPAERQMQLRGEWAA